MKSASIRITSYVLALAAGMVLGRFRTVPAHSGSPQAGISETDGSHPAPRIGGSRGSRGSSGSMPEACSRAWEILQDQSRSDRKRLTPLLLAEWMKVDLAGALGAALDSENPAELLELFQEAFDQDPAAFKRSFDGERFGLKTAEVRSWWIAKMAAKDPAALLAAAHEFGAVDCQRSIQAAFAAMNGDPQQVWKALHQMAALPDGEDQRRQWEFAATALARSVDPGELVVRLSEISGAAGDVMLSHAMVMMLEKTDYQGARRTYETLPADLKPQILKAALEQPGKNAQAYLAAIDEVLNTPGWKDLQIPVAMNLHEMEKSGSQQTALLEWASHLPEREDTMDLYRVAVRTFMSSEPQSARDWIDSQPDGWKQQNALAAYVQTSLSARGDVQGAQWAFQQIHDVRFRQEAEGFFNSFEKSQRK